jgi:hypothetical protein
LQLCGEKSILAYTPCLSINPLTLIPPNTPHSFLSHTPKRKGNQGFLFCKDFLRRASTRIPPCKIHLPLFSSSIKKSKQLSQQIFSGGECKTSLREEVNIYERIYGER